MIALIVPPFPAVSLPSNTTQTFAAEAFTHACIATSSPCSRRNSRSCCFLFILACGSACAASAVAVWPSPSTSSRRLVFLPPRPPSARPRLGTPSQRHVLLHAVTEAQPTTHVSIYLRVNPWPTRHLPVRHRMAVNRTSRARPACLAASGLAIDWAAGMLQAGILVGAWAPVRFLTHTAASTRPDARTFGAASLRSDAVEGRYRTPAIGTVANVDGLQAAQPEAGMELDLMRWG